VERCQKYYFEPEGKRGNNELYRGAPPGKTVSEKARKGPWDDGERQKCEGREKWGGSRLERSRDYIILRYVFGKQTMHQDNVVAGRVWDE